MIGGDVVRRIKADLRTARHSGIVNSAFEEYVKHAIAAGVDQILYKPADLKSGLVPLGDLSVQDVDWNINYRQDEALVRNLH